MTVFTEGQRTGEFILSEGNGSISRESVTLAPVATRLVPGTVLGRLANGTLAPYNNAGTGGVEVAVAILYAHADVSATAQSAVVIARAAEVAAAQLTGLDTPARADLAAVGIIVR